MLNMRISLLLYVVVKSRDSLWAMISSAVVAVVASVSNLGQRPSSGIVWVSVLDKKSPYRLYATLKSPFR